ncbi:predicted protein [Naegleria gruberi]|uniref:Predicted protein n=1 Tax=Naegleria gruberi TaxID=5762 RepID=D2VN23_NAEGR|nr:uncharacterized protein NAEGRDRAFT_70345 [Naegleria gruberi]EFC41919.1 predicted protein [Naegleria gruberi]|eukprot:XP_002674663.1 predicted protein [Naegleria gruberi strain NEG-M]
MEELLDKPVLPDLVIRERKLLVMLQNFIQSTNSTENLPILATFLKYSKIAARDIIGGNPEISHIKRRITSFVKNPSPIKFRTIPIWEAMPDGSHQRRNLKIAYKKCMEKSVAKKERRIQRIENMITKQTSQPILLKVFLQQSPCGYQDFSQNICRAGKNGIRCKSGSQRPACTILITKIS